MRLRAWASLFAALLLAWAMFSFFHMFFRFESKNSHKEYTPWLIYKKETLVMYLFAASDSEFFDSLHFFISEVASNPDDQARCDYVFIIQDYKGDGTEVQ